MGHQAEFLGNGHRIEFCPNQFPKVKNQTKLNCTASVRDRTISQSDRHLSAVLVPTSSK
jgi:hypothetical protein